MQAHQTNKRIFMNTKIQRDYYHTTEVLIMKLITQVNKMQATWQNLQVEIQPMSSNHSPKQRKAPYHEIIMQIMEFKCINGNNIIIQKLLKVDKNSFVTKIIAVVLTQQLKINQVSPYSYSQ